MTEKSDIEKEISRLKSEAEQHEFVCERCRAINQSPDIQEEDKLIHTKNGMQDMVLDEEPENMPDHIQIDKENLIEQTIVFWRCAVCKHQHRILTNRDPPIPQIDNTTVSSDVSTTKTERF
jgi:hypothetical protein